MMTENEILELLKYGEHINLECKKAESTIPKSVWETYSAFANTDGGVILFGVEEHINEPDMEKRFTFVSINNPTKRLKEFWDTINGEKVNTNILLDKQVGFCQVRGANIMYIDVPTANYKQKPIYINGNPMKGTFKRNHEGDYHCTEDEVKAMIRDNSDNGSDGSLLVGYTMDDVDKGTLRAYRMEFLNRNPDHVWNMVDDETFLKNMGGYAVDRTTGKAWLTQAGLLMFGTGLAVRECFDNIRMDYLDTTNLVSDSSWSDRITYDGMWENNLYNFLKIVMPKLTSNLKRPFKLEGMVRIDDTPLHKAIREAVINMLIHSDYHIIGILRIDKTDTGFIFANPGNLKLSVQEIYEGGHSVARNPRIQNMLRMIGYGDNIGSGFPKIIAVWKQENWRQPDLSQNDDVHQVELKLWTISLMPQECSEFLTNLYGNAYAQLDSNSQIILGTAYLEKYVTNARLQLMLDMHKADIGHTLGILVERKMLLSDNKGRWTKYCINTEYEQLPEQTVLTALGDQEPKLKNKSDREIYNFIKTNGFITTNQVVQGVTSIKTLAGASVALGRLIKLGLVKKLRKGNNVVYILQE